MFEILFNLYYATLSGFNIRKSITNQFNAVIGKLIKLIVNEVALILNFLLKTIIFKKIIF